MSEGHSAAVLMCGSRKRAGRDRWSLEIKVSGNQKKKKERRMTKIMNNPHCQFCWVEIQQVTPRLQSDLHSAKTKRGKKKTGAIKITVNFPPSRSSACITLQPKGRHQLCSTQWSSTHSHLRSPHCQQTLSFDVSLH